MDHKNDSAMFSLVKDKSEESIEQLPNHGSVSPAEVCERASKASESCHRDSDFFECDEREDDFEGKFDSESETTVQDATGATTNTVKETRREVTYTAYAENIEACVRLLSCSKNVTLIEKEDIKKTRMFVTSLATIQEQKVDFGSGRR
jgi:hypothetical protein